MKKWYEYLGFTGKLKSTSQKPVKLTSDLTLSNCDYSHREYTDQDEYDSPYSLQNQGSHL